MPIDRGTIDQQLEAIGEGGRWWDQREMRDLPAILDSRERILAITRGKVARVRVLRHTWLIVVTDKRLLCIRSGRGSAWKQFDMSALQISRVALRIGPFRGRVLVGGSGRTCRLLVARRDAHALVNALSSIMTPANEPSTRFKSTVMVRRVIDHVLALPAVALGPDGETRPALPPAPDTLALDDRMRSLEEEVEELRKQVDFLEQLLRQHQS